SGRKSWDHGCCHSPQWAGGLGLDIRAKVEARKAELAAGDLAAKNAAEEAERARIEAERVRRQAALDEIAQAISKDGPEVHRIGEEIELVPALEPLDVEGLRRD